MSNALRTALDYAAQDQQQRAIDAEAVAASEMGSLRRGYEAGRIGTDVNANNADIASMRNAGRMQEADALAQQNLALQQRQAMYAPEIARVEDVGSKQGYLRDGVSWFGTQLGQMGASAQDPVALTAAGTAIGKAIGAVPRLSAVGKAIQYGSQAGAFGLNQRQMTGEMYGRLADDPQALANMTPQEAYRTSNLYGLAAGAAESLLPGVVGHSLGGGALKAGAKAATGRGAGMTLLGDAALETGTELGQQYGQQRVHSAYNPTRDTSQDASELLNAAAGGAAGGFGMGAPHAIADSAYGRTARAGELVKEKAGEVVDLTKEKAPQIYEDTGIKGVVDLGMQGGKSILGSVGKGVKAAQDYVRDASGKINYAEGIKRAQADVERFKMSQEEADLLTAAPPAEADSGTLATWTEQNYADRTNYVFGKLEALERDGVQEATGFLDALESDDPVARTQAVDEATSFLLERNAAAQVRERATLFQAAIGEFIQKGAARMTRGAKAAGDAAAFAGLNVAEGVKQGLESKKNMQGAGFSTLDYDNWKTWRDQNALPLGEDSQRAHSIQKAVEGRTRRKEMKGLVPRPADPEAAKRSYERATLFGEMLAAEAAARRAKVMGHRADEADGVIDYTNYVRSLAYEVEDMAEGWAARAADPVTKRGPRIRTTDQASVALGLVDSMAEDLSNVLGPVAGDVVARMAQSAEPTAKAFFDVLQERVANRQATAAERKVQDQSLQDQMLALLPQEYQATLREDGGAGARSLQQTVQMIARGRVPPAKRREIEQAIGAGTLNRMLSLYGETAAPETQVGTVVVDDTGATPARAPLESDEAMGDDAETSAWEARMKEKTSERGAGEKRYGVSFSPTMRTDPFEPLKKLSKEELAAFRDEDRQRAAAGEARIYPDVDRPRLFTKGQTNHDGSDAMMKRAEAMAEKLGPEFAISPWRAEGSQPAVEPRSAKSVMDDMGMPTSKRLAIYRDYMNSAATNDKLTAEQRKAAAKHARAAQLALLDAVENPEVWGRQNRNTAELTEEQSAARKTPPGDVERLISRMLERRSKAVQAELDTYGADLDNKVYGELDSPEPKKANSARLTAGERGAVHAAMDRYFSERFLVVAERKIDREYSRIDSVELRDMIQRGRKAYDHIKDDQNEVAGANLLWFKSPLADERTGTPGMVPIRANNLVAWVRKQRALGEEFEARDRHSNRDKNEAFLDDLSEGISIVMSSGHVEATMPYMLDKFGAKKSLQKDYPDNLELETSTYGGYKFGRQQQVAKLDDNPDGPRWKDQNIAGPRDPRSVENATDDPKNQKKVAFDQQTADLEDGGGNDAPAIRADKSNEGTLDPYTDIAVKAGLRAKAVPPKQTRAGKRAKQHAVAAAAARRGGKSSDDAEAANIKNTRVDANKIDKDLLWESGLESDKIRDDEQTTVEKEEVSKRSKDIAKGIGPEPKVTAKRFAEDRAGALIEVFRKEGTDAGLAALERRMRTAKETNTNPRAGVVGGAHYAYPLAHVLNPETIGGMDLGTAEAARVVAMRTELAGLVLTSPSLDLADKVVMAKAMAPKASRDRITAANVLKVLSKASETQPAAPEVAATGAPKSQAKPGGVKLNGKTPFTSKDQAKADRATKFIGRGSERSSTALYAKDFGALANTGSYTAEDTVFVSAEGARAGRVEPDFAELDKAVAARATIVTDDATNRAREYNVGERQVAAHLEKKGYTETSPGTWTAPKRKLNAQGTLQGGVAADMMGSRDIMRTLGFKAAPPQFADVASKLLVSPDVDADTFIKQSAEGISYLLMEGASGEQIRSVLGNDYWAPTRYKVAARLMAGGMQRGDALVASYREMVRMALTKELTTRGIATKTFVGRVTQLARELVSKFRKLTQSEQFADLVRNNLNDLIAKAAGPVDLKANYRKVTFQDAVDADPQAARVLAHMSKLPGTMLTGSIVLAANGPIYRDASNMLHDLDFVVDSRDASIAHLTKAFPDATKVYDFQTSNGKVDTYIVPPPGAKITSIERKGSKVVGFTVVRDGVEIGRTWNDENGEHKTGEPGTFVDFFSGTKDGKAVSTAPFKVDGTAYQIATSPVGAIFNAKLSMGRSKDLTDYLRFAPNVGRKLSLMSTQVHNDLQRGGFAATHDSPVRHEGKFNWREHTGKGEGNAAFGAGTYLSTGEKVHGFYKKMMSNKTSELRDLVQSMIGSGPVTAESKADALSEARAMVTRYKKDLEESDYPPDHAGLQAGLEQWTQIERQLERAKIGMPFDMETKSPTYHVSVNIMKAQLLNWDKPLSEQSSYVRKRLEGELVASDPWKDDQEYQTAELTDGSSVYIEVVSADSFYAAHVSPGGKAKTIGTFASRGDAERAVSKYLGDARLQLVYPPPSGADIYRALTKRLGSQRAASDYLQSLGILGHEYAAANGRNSTTPNYVIYDDSKITTNYVHFNKQEANNFENWKNGPQARAAQGMATDADLKAAREYFDRVLGKQVKAEFENITGYSGEFIVADNLIKVSTLTNAGVMNVARHEALHAFFSKFIKANPKAVKVLSSLTDNERVLRRLQTLLKDEPAALEQLVDGEERLAYIYQFAMSGQLRLPHTPGTTLLHKVRKFLRRVFQMVSDDERAVDLLYAFEHGKMSDPSAGARAMAKVLDQGTWMTKGARSIDAVTQRAAAMVLPANTILAESISPTARALAKQFFTNPGEEGAAEGGKGYLNARNEGMRQYDNLFRKAIDKLDKRQLDELTEAMQNETPTGDVRDPDVAAAKEQLHALFARFHRYLTEEKGLRIGKINEGYFPVVYDVDKVREGGLEKLLSGKYIGEINKMAAAINDKRASKNPDAEMVSSDEVISAIVNHITRDNPLDDAELEPQRQDGVLRPWFASGERRVLDFLSPEDRAQFQEKDIIKTVSRYVRQGVRTAEYSSRFGRTGAVLDRQLDKIQMELEEASREMLAAGDLKNEKAREKWVKRQYRDVANAVGGMEGSLGHDISEGIRKINSWSIVYQNVRLLPLALFSSFVDPLGIVARGGEMREAFTTFTEGIRGVARQWADAIREEPADRQKSQWEELAEHAGVIDTATFSHLLADEYGSVYLDGTTKKINEVMFKANGMEAWNRAMRVGATRSAVRFMERHNKAPTEHSARWMKDLGFEPGTLPLDSEGKLITDKRVMMSENPGMEMAEAEAQIAKVHSAINRWVEGAILSPNAAQRPAWGSDPHYSMFWHLKQFAYSFHETIMKRALNEAKHGNVMPLGVFAWYIPTMIAADVTKGLMLGAGELPAYMKGYDLGDWMLHGVERSGVLGIGQVAIDGVQDPTGLAGPAVEQITDIFVQPMEQNIVKALPVNALYSRALL